MLGDRHWVVVVLALAALLTVVSLAEDARSDVAPMVDRPTGNGPMPVGQFDTTIRCSTKAYDTDLRVYYPADEFGIGTAPDASGAPYMTIVWMPFYGGQYDILDFQGEQLASYGAVVVVFGVNWNDFPSSGGVSDMNDLLDMLEDLNVTSGHILEGMVDQEAFGICGHSSGGGFSLVNGAQVARFRAVQAFGAAIGAGTVDAIAPLFAGKPVLLQVGQEDAQYIDGSRRAYERIGAPCSLVETVGGYHSGPFQDHMYIAFYMYHLARDEDYFTFLYGDDAVQVAAEGLADVQFKLGGDHFFPPTLTASVSPRYAPMDTPVSLNASVRGYQRANDSDLVLGWDVDGDGIDDVSPTGGPNATYEFTSPGRFDVVLNYSIGALSIISDPHRVDVSNVDPTAVAGPDVEVDHDGYARLDGGASFDTPSDVGRLLFRWVFSDGLGTDVTAHPEVTRQFLEVGVVVATLTVFDPHGGESTDVLNVTVVNVPPSVTTGERLTVNEDSTATFDGTGHDTPSHEAGLRYLWDFGDGMGSDWRPSPQATHSYARSGNYTARLSVKDPEGAEGEVTTLVTVLNVAPVGAIDLPIDGSAFDKGEPVEFKATGSDTPSDEVDLVFMWEFGDGEVSTWLGRRDTQMFHTYSSGGVYQVVLSVKDSDGALARASSTVTVLNQPPRATILRPWPSATVDEDTRVTFDGRGSDTPGDQAGLEFEWVIDGATFEGDHAEVNFTRSGTYLAQFRVTDPEGATGSISVNVTVVNIAPVVTVSAIPREAETGGSVNLSVAIQDSLSDMGDHYVVWDFGDGGTGYGIGTDHAYSANGTYIVKVTVEDDDGATASATVTITVTDPPREPTDPGDDDPSGPSGSGSYGPYIVVGLVILAVIVTVLVLLYRRGDGPRGEGGGLEG